MPFVQAGDLRIHVQVQGRGSPLVLIIGLSGDLTWWERLVPLLEADFRVVTFDNRGAGLTDKPDVKYTIAGMAGDTAALMDALNIPRAHVFGISMGGMIAQELALRHPGRVDRLALGCTHSGGAGLKAPSAEVIRRISETQGKSLAQIAQDVMGVIFSPAFLARDPDYVRSMIERYIEHPPSGKGFTRQFWAVVAHDAFDRLPGLCHPTLILSGDVDILVPPENSRVLHSRIPGSRLACFPNAGHAFFMEEPERTARHLRQHFLGSQPPL